MYLTHRDFSHQTGAPTSTGRESREPQKGKNLSKPDFFSFRFPVISLYFSLLQSRPDLSSRNLSFMRRLSVQFWRSHKASRAHKTHDASL